jgi:hypothetical protein
MTTVLPPVELPEPLSVDELVRLDDEAFTDYVHDALPEPGMFITLHKPALASRMLTTLGVLIQDLHDTMRENRRDMPPAAYQAWCIDFAFPTERLLQGRIARAKGAVRAGRETLLKRQISEQKVAVRRLLDVVGRLAEEIHHRLAVLAGGFEPEPYERAMWAALAALRVPVDGEDVSLDEALGRGLIGGAR